MTAFVAVPLPFTIDDVNTNQSALAPASNLSLDRAGLVWRTNNLTNMRVVADMGTTASYDVVALIGSNLRSTDTIRVLAGDVYGTWSYSMSFVPAWTGTKPAGASSKYVLKLPSALSYRYVCVEVVAAGHPDGYVEAQRLVIGTAITTNGVADAEMSFVDQSVINEGPGWVSIDEYPILPSWKVQFGWISGAQYHQDWIGFFLTVGKKRGFLFVPDYEETDYHQSQVIFGRITVDSRPKHPVYDLWKIEMNIQSYAP